LGLTQAQVARKLSKPQSFVSKLESGERRVDFVELQQLAKIYKKPLSFFRTI
jgi:transcriptional regulator with XRE-family HTH domain